MAAELSIDSGCCLTCAGVINLLMMKFAKDPMQCRSISTPAKRFFGLRERLTVRAKSVFLTNVSRVPEELQLIVQYRELLNKMLTSQLVVAIVVGVVNIKLGP